MIKILKITTMENLLTWFRNNYTVLPKHVELSSSIAKTKKLIPILCESKRDFVLEIQKLFNMNADEAIIHIETHYNTMLMFSKDGEWILNILSKDTIPLRYRKFINDTSNILINKSISPKQLTINFSKSNISRKRYVEMMLEYNNNNNTITPDVILDFISQTQLLQPYFDVIEQYVTPYMIVYSVLSKKKNNN